MTKADLHKLVDRLPDEVVDDVARWLERAQDPVIARLDGAPVDDEPLTDAERAAITAARSDPAPSIPVEDLGADDQR